MKTQKKWLIATTATGFVGFGLLLFSQTSDQVIGGSENHSPITTVSAENLQYEVAKNTGTQTASVTKPHFNHSHNHNDVEYDNEPVESFDEMEIFDHSSIGIHLKEHFDLLENTEPDSQEKQDESFEKMRETPELYVTKLTEAYEHVERVNFLARYKVVYLMENLKSSLATPFLSEIANSAFPEETTSYKGDGHVDEAHHESLIRMRAVGGLYTLAAEGDEGARVSLFDAILNTKDRTVKNDAIWSYLSTSTDLETDKEYLKSVLPEEDHQFVTIKLTSIENVQEQLELIDENQQLL